MANSLLTPTVILKEAGRLFHQQARFIPKVNRQYDGQFKRDGAKVGYSISLRDRNQYTVTTGATLAVQDTTEASQTLTVNTQKHVGLNFTSADLTMVIDEFSDRYIKPAVAALVANVESDALISMRKKVANIVDDDGTAFSYLDVAKAKQKLDESLTPGDERTLLLCPTHATKYLDASKGFYNPAAGLGQQYTSGIVKDFTGFDIGATTHLTNHQTGTAAKTTGYTVNGASQTGSSITIQSGSTTFLIGDTVTFAGCNAVHPETKADLGYLKQFTVTANSGTSATTLSISPAIVASGAKQNVSASPTNSGAVVKLCAGASETQVESLAFHKDAFIFGTVDLEDMSRYGGWGAVEEMDGLSMRIWRQGDIVNDSAPCRIDILYGFLARYPQMACRIHADG
jgi:hypothetical protein